MKLKFLALTFFIQTLSIIAFCSSGVFSQTNTVKPSSESNNCSTTELSFFPAQTGFVNDFANVIDQETKAKLEQTLKDFKRETKVDFVIATVKTTGEKQIFDYSLSLANDWKVGSKNFDKSGMLMLIAIEDRKWFIQISRSMEAILTNGEVGQWGALVRPFFKEKKYGEGITESVAKFIEVLKERRKPKTETAIK